MNSRTRLQGACARTRFGGDAWCAGDRRVWCMGVTHANTALRRIPVLWGTRAVGHPLLHGRAPLGVHGCSHGACDPNESPLKAWRKADAISSLDETGGQALVCALSRLRGASSSAAGAWSPMVQGGEADGQKHREGGAAVERTAAVMDTCVCG
jgi:hypothetical protein